MWCVMSGFRKLTFIDFLFSLFDRPKHPFDMGKYKDKYEQLEQRTFIILIFLLLLLTIILLLYNNPIFIPITPHPPSPVLILQPVNSMTPSMQITPPAVSPKLFMVQNNNHKPFNHSSSNFQPFPPPPPPPPSSTWRHRNRINHMGR